MLEWLLDQVFPKKCIVCERRGTALCLICKPRLPYLPVGLCTRCASQRGARGVCQGCRRLSPAISRIIAGFSYSGAARQAVLLLKFRSGRYLTPMMGELLVERLRTQPVKADLVVPVPLSRVRQRARGYNQAHLLAEWITASVGGALTPHVLSRSDRPPQQTLSAAERMTNLAGVFTCRDPGEVGGKHILLIDDVITTGATVSACADTLAEAGAVRVSALAFARDL